ncbi:hypothetical protein BCR42DRAFT_461344 [Absidia repens]|uniref:Transmembrane protein 135 N-terminal domain-containing protein n=1 Tax=Absidia repens TaxID=90262 RepID=A0A1X2IDT6_9FUNG|nr:hypothetical protein BCR42DRAFT_461344 [Absidia repens]
MDSSIPPIPPSYYENFIESLAQIVSKLLTDKETETILTSILSFQERIKRLSSQNLKRLNVELDTTTHLAEAPTYVCKHEGKTCAQNCTRGFIKAYAVAFSVKYLIGIIPSLLTGKLFKTPSLLKRMAGSTFLSSYKGILCLMRRLRGKADDAGDRLNAFVAGAVAGLSLMIDPDRRRRQSIMMYLLTRCFQFSGGWLLGAWAKSRHARQQEPTTITTFQTDRQTETATSSDLCQVDQTWEDVLAKALERYAGVFVMMLSSSQLIFAFLFDSDTLTKSYQSFLLEHAGWKDDVGNMALPISHAVCDTIHRMTDNTDASVPFRIPTDTTSRDFVAEYISPSIATVIPKDIRHRYAICAIQHPLDPDCTISKFTLARGELRRALKLYVPLNVIMTLVFRYNKMKSE